MMSELRESFEKWFENYNTNLHLSGDGIQSESIKNFMMMSYEAGAIANMEVIEEVNEKLTKMLTDDMGKM